ncbi:ABC transporter substrate-binding protein [Methanosalsum natronophilum]|uniref:ABC transporter substrate-binding protein n=1 Tax=Methanosalsum natronophilum TaxID=768733 RepID=A0A3R7VYU6_9EURY|nr:ABC transporter substrate-binding protein [Methanosalsum natronophilum]MCS3923559.1 NitT/TauT family transport system substrate-binding protein [Methanosalsum natronophilum]RQD89199.1 MAG: ABC transporter substrate-binding protein [Methanosalsum natronophilum]
MKLIKKNSVKVVIISMLVLLAAVMFAGCAMLEDDTELRFSYQPSTHQIAYMIAEDKGWWLEDLAPYGIESIDDREFGTGAPQMQAMMAGHTDVAYVGAAPYISALDKGLDAKIVAAVQTQGSSLVLLDEHAETYESPEDLRGLTIATFPPGTIQDTILRTWLKDNGLEPGDDVEIAGMGPGEAVSAITAGQVDGVFLPHPSPSIIVNEGAGTIVAESGEIAADHACCVLVVSGELIRENPEMVEQIVRTHIRANNYVDENHDEAADVYAKFTGQSAEVTKQSLVDWDGEFVSDPNIIVDATLAYAQQQHDLGYVDKELTKEDIFDTSFYEAAKD